MAGTMQKTAYTSDNGTGYEISQDASNAAAIGNAVAAAGTSSLPTRVYPRYILAQHPTTFRERKIAVGSVANALWTGTGGTIDLVDYNTSLPVHFVLKGRIGERRFG